MVPNVDYHMHTPLCGHAKGDPQEYAARAIEMGLNEIGFSDHAPLLSHRDPTITMDMSQLELYHTMIESVRDELKDKLTVRIGIEADFLPGYEDRTRALLARYPYDYVIGSVHFISDWGFDDPIQLKQWDKKDVNKVYRDYYKLVRKSAASRLFDIIGHADLVKKFDFHPTEDMTGEIEENARAFKKSGVVVEINTSGLRRPIREAYPSPLALKIYQRHGVPLTFGSDAHTPKDVGRDLDKARELAITAGYKEYAVFKGRRIAEMRPL
ncbi:MAG: histidinol-phosphatase HisJ [Elusimicrobia bacterium]|nr:histidinol-phosphatase HisJ [Elusimicrobiota bacterium]